LKICITILGERTDRQICGDLAPKESARHVHFLDMRTCKDIQLEDNAQTARARIKVFA